MAEIISISTLDLSKLSSNQIHFPVVSGKSVYPNFWKYQFDKTTNLTVAWKFNKKRLQKYLFAPKTL